MRVIEDVPLGLIEAGDRRREDYGDIGGLAAGMKRVGLLSPILLAKNGDDSFRLVFGGRRLKAARLLKWETIPAMLRENLSDEEFRDIELEENENRKALTEGERARTFESSKRLIEKARKASEVLAHNGPKVSTGGRPSDPASTRAVAQALGTSRQNIERAEQHVQAAERFPFMQGGQWRQSQVLAVRESLEKIPESEQGKVAGVLSCAKVIDPATAVKMVVNLAAKPKPERQAIYGLSVSSDPRDRSLALTKAAELPPMPDPRLGLIQAALESLRRASEPYPKDELTPRIAAVIGELRAIRSLVKNVSFDARVKGASVQ